MGTNLLFTQIAPIHPFYQPGLPGRQPPHAVVSLSREKPSVLSIVRRVLKVNLKHHRVFLKYNSHLLQFRRPVFKLEAQIFFLVGVAGEHQFPASSRNFL